MNKKKVKIIGAGSIGNHLANAARNKEWEVVLCDVDPLALERTKKKIYPARYGSWDNDIKLCHVDDAPKNNFNYIFIGTPPDTHIDIALSVIDEEPEAILIEKPVSQPSLENAERLVHELEKRKIKGFVGYDHVVGSASIYASNIMNKINKDDIETLDVDIREHWGGIFNAHPWLSGPKDTYLGFWERGGGACGEHSHGINLWQHFAHEIGAGKVIEVSATLDYVNNDEINYDRLCFINLKTESGLCGRVVQDVVTQPPRKVARLQCKNSFVEWHCNLRQGVDAVFNKSGEDEQTFQEHFEKTRPDDFIQELTHMENIIENDAESPISLERGMDTMLVISAAHKSSQEKKVVNIDYSKGYTLDALV